MKKSSGVIIAAAVHTILWIVVLLVSVVGKITFNAPEMEPIEFALSKEVYNVFIIIAAAGVLNSALMLFSLYSASTASITKSKVLAKLAIVFSAVTNILFYLSVVLIFNINTDAVIIAPIVCAVFAACCCIILIVLRTKKRIMPSSGSDFNSIDKPDQN